MNPAEKKHVASNPIDNNNISIPEDILSLIFQQLPAKTLVRFNCVSKNWCNIIEEFIDAYRVRSHNHNGFNLLVCRPRMVRFKALVRHDVRFAVEVRERVALIDWDCTKFWILEGFESAKWNVMDILWPKPWILNYEIRHDEYPMVHAEPIGLIETGEILFKLRTINAEFYKDGVVLKMDPQSYRVFTCLCYNGDEKNWSPTLELNLIEMDATN